MNDYFETEPGATDTKEPSLDAGTKKGNRRLTLIGKVS